MARVIQKKKGFKIDFDFILKIFFTLFAAAILVLVVLKVVERVENSKVDEPAEPLFALSEYKDAYVRYNYEDGLDGFFEDEGFVQANANNGHDGAVFVFVYNSNLDVYVNKSLETKEEQNELKNFITEDSNEQRPGDQSFYQLATDYIKALNVDGKKVIYLLDVYSHDSFYGQVLPGSSYTISRDSLACIQISFQYDNNGENKLDKNAIWDFTSTYSTTYDRLNEILGEILYNSQK